MPQRIHATLNDVKREVESHKGDLIKLQAHKSKKKLYRKIGRIEGIYPSIFTVKVENPRSHVPERLSFSYSDVLTRAVRIALIKDEEQEAEKAMTA